MQLCVAAFCSMALLCGITWHEVITVYLFNLLRMDVGAISGLGLKTRQTFSCISSGDDKCLFPLQPKSRDTAAMS